VTIKVITVAEGMPREHVLSLPETLTITVTRQDGFAPSQMEIYTAMTIALDAMKLPKKPKGKST
jgi:hypothetical protein